MSTLPTDLYLQGAVSYKKLRAALLRGSALSLLGTLLWAIPFFWAGLSPCSGSAAFFGGAFLVATGLIPYKLLNQQALRPPSLWLQEENLIYCHKGTPSFFVEVAGISKVELDEEGLALFLKEGAPVLLDNTFNLPRFQKKAQKKGCDLFLPHFSKRCWRQLLLYLES